MARKATTTTRSFAADNARPGQVVGEEQIRRRAYELYEKRRGNGGDADGDWYRAEAELREEAGQGRSDVERPIAVTLD